MSTFIPLPPECDLSHVEPVKLTPEQEKLFNAHLDVLEQGFFLEAISEWRIPADQKMKLLREYSNKLDKAVKHLDSLT